VLVAVISDTHMPRGARRLPDACVAELQRADLIVHAGDFVVPEVLAELEAYGEVVGVHGNVDSYELRGMLPAERVVELERARIAITHDPGPAAGRLARLRGRFPDADAVVFGHTHLPEHGEQDGFQIFNPGSPTERRRAPGHTMGLARIADGAIRFELLSLD
jgi:putative phosphoesterase